MISAAERKRLSISTRTGKGDNALAESGEVLKSQNRCGRQHGNLPAFLDHFESGAHGKFRLAVSHVAAEQAVHGLRSFQGRA